MKFLKAVVLVLFSVSLLYAMPSVSPSTVQKGKYAEFNITVDVKKGSAVIVEIPASLGKFTLDSKKSVWAAASGVSISGQQVIGQKIIFKAGSAGTMKIKVGAKFKKGKGVKVSKDFSFLVTVDDVATVLPIKIGG